MGKNMTQDEKDGPKSGKKMSEGGPKDKERKGTTKRRKEGS